MMELTNKDIHKIIDDAMEKKDRCVSIFISNFGTTVHVDPFDNHKPHWIPKYQEGMGRWPASYICSECGVEHKHIACYCGFCGEKLALLPEDENGRN